MPTLEEIGSKLKDFGDRAVSGLDEVRKQAAAIGAGLEAKLTAAEKRIDDLSAQLRERPADPTKKAMDDVDWKKFNMAKAVLASLDAQKGHVGSWDKYKAGYERDAIDHVKKTMTVAVEPSGGFLVPAEMMAGYIEPFRSKVPSFVIPGIQNLTGLTGSPVKLPRQTTDVTSYWLSETGAPTRNDPVFDQILMTPKKCGAETRLSRDLLLQSPVAADQVARSSIFESMLRLQDTAFWQGTGASGQPVGMDNYAGINTVSFSGATAITTWSLLDQMVEEIEADDGPSENLVWVMHPRVWAHLRQLQKPEAAASAGNRIIDNGNYQQGVQRNLLGYPVYLTTNITASTTSIIKLFDPANIVRGTWGTVEIFVTDDGATLRSSDLIQVNGWSRVDHHVKRPVSICTGTAFTY